MLGNNSVRCWLGRYWLAGITLATLSPLSFAAQTPSTGEASTRKTSNTSEPTPTDAAHQAANNGLSGDLQLVDSSGRPKQDAAVASSKAAKSPTSSEGRRASNIATLIASLTVFVLAVFIGFEVIAKVPPTLHTPLMSGSNAISGITIVGAILAAGHALGGFGSMLGMLAVVLATINVVGGFLVTHRMLLMFKKR